MTKKSEWFSENWIFENKVEVDLTEKQEQGAWLIHFSQPLFFWGSNETVGWNIPLLFGWWYKNKKAALAKGDYIYIVPRQVYFQKLSQHFCWLLEQKTRLELATPTLARLCSTNWATSAYFPNGIAKVRRIFKLPNFSRKNFKKMLKFLQKPHFSSFFG